MADLLNRITEKLGNFAGKWTAYAAFGSFLLYLVGYLTLRFQLSVYGLSTDLDLFDEKYLFAGCRFVVYLVSSIPNILIILLVLAPILYLPYRLLAASVRDRLRQGVSAWCARPLRLPLLGIVVSVLFIQFVMRGCFAFGNLLLERRLPDEWISDVLLSSNARLALYFGGLVMVTLLTATIARRAIAGVDSESTLGRFFIAVLVFLVAVQFLLLPVNYGVLVSTQQLPRVAELSGGVATPEGQRAWMVWNSKETLTYFIYSSPEHRALVTVPRKDAQITIVAYDDIYCVLFSSDHSISRPCPR